MILENGVVRTMEPSLPVVRALAIAGEWIAGGVGTHEAALPSPERVDLGGRCVLPGLNDAHVHFPTWAVARREVRLEGARSLEEAVARVADVAPSVPEGRWLRGFGWRSGEWSPPVEPTKEALDRVTGDTREALDAFEATRDLWAPRRLRPRIEHAQLLAPEDLPRFARLGVAASVQFSHAPSDRDLADRFWAGKTDGAYAYRSLLDGGAVLANGSDAPIEELEPWAGVCAGVIRTIDERPSWHPEQRVTLEEALLATTVTPAWLARDERRRGKLVPGYLADLVVLDRDPFELEPEELPTVRVVATMVGGRWMHNPPPWD